jgi:hypothetical protein
MSSKIILLNGPKTCGKNITVDRIKELSSVEVVDKRCKDHLFTLTAALFRMTMEEFNTHYECRETKETAKEEFTIDYKEFNRLAPHLGVCELIGTGMVALSVREALIYVSEVVCKPAFGSDYFGVVRAESIDTSNDNTRAIDDSCGFDDEIPPTIDKLGMDNIMLIRIHSRGSFDGDSRNYISDGVVDNTLDIYNETTEEEFLTAISDIALEFYNK